MSYIADLHIHSRFSRACSPQLNIPNLVEWCKLKGINLMGTGDFLHPLWLSELKNQLVEDGSGFLSQKGNPSTSLRTEREVRFVLTVEIASIYTHKGKGRRIHNLVFLPDFESADKFQKALLTKRATLASDGRPIVGIPTKELLYMALQANDKAILIPAHIWTPWFGLLGSMSGYDSMKECFEDLTDQVYGIETGLSSDPGMNWRVSELDNKSILSFSDAHSLPNLGREATVFGGKLEDGYEGMFRSIKSTSVIPSKEGIQAEQETGSPIKSGMTNRVNDNRIIGTIEFYPEEGKYHYSGHRNCSVKYTPEDTKQKGNICPVCKSALTEGVMERVEVLATRTSSEFRVKNEEGKMISESFPEKPGYRMLVPLMQIIAEAFSSTTSSQKVIIEYKKLTSQLGGEIKVLTKADLSEIEKIVGRKIAEGIERDRTGKLEIDPGYDGVYGVVKIWNDVKEEKIVPVPQLGLFD